MRRSRHYAILTTFCCGWHNETAGTMSSHRPTDVDGLVSQSRVVAEAYPEDELEGWKSDFLKA